MHLYHLTLQAPSAIIGAVVGNFSGTKQQEIALNKGRVLELLRPDAEGKLQTLLSVHVFGEVRALRSFRLTGGSKDYLLVGSDSGKFVILSYDPVRNELVRVHEETYGKSGCRRIVPGQYVATDPRGRAAMVGAVEKQKLVYVLNRDSAANLTISSPLSAHKAHHITFALVGVDVGFDNPVFAALEVDCEDAAEPGEHVDKQLIYYELDLGLNHVVRKWSAIVDMSSASLISVPGANEGPGGVLVCAHNFLTYKNMGHADVTVAYPRARTLAADADVFIVCTATHKQKDLFFFLLQNEQGDLYKVTLDYEDETVHAINVCYFDTVPVANSMCVLKSGFLFVAAEFSNHMLYVFQSIGDDDAGKNAPTVPLTYADPSNGSAVGGGNTQTLHAQVYEPRLVEQEHISAVDELQSLSPVTEFQVYDLFGEETPQLFALCGRGDRSSLRVLRHGLGVTEMAVSPLPGTPSGVWTVRDRADAAYDTYIVVSFINATLVLSIGESVEEVTDSGLLGEAQTMYAGAMADDSLVQVYKAGVRLVRADKRVEEWKPPARKTIVHCAANARQVVIALSSNDLIYLELDAAGRLSETKRMLYGSAIVCLEIAPVAHGRQRAKFLAVAEADNSVRVLSLVPAEALDQLALQALPTRAESLCMLEMQAYGARRQNTGSTLFLNIGLTNGVMLRTVVDPISGQLADTRTRFLGTKPVRLQRVTVNGLPACLCLSSRVWLSYNFQNTFHLSPLSYQQLDSVASFASEQCSEGVCAVSGDTLRIFALDRLGEMFNQTEVPLQRTPRRFVLSQQHKRMAIVETDHRRYGSDKIAELHAAVKSEEGADAMQVDAGGGGSGGGLAAGDAYNRGEKGSWASHVRLLDPATGETLSLFELKNNEAAFCVALVAFKGKYDGEELLVVGGGRDVTTQPRSCAEGFIHVLRFVDGGARLELVHTTTVENVPLALIPFQGRLLAGIGRTLRMYDLGKRKLLRKCESSAFPVAINRLHYQADRIIVGDMAESFFFVMYTRADNAFHVFADDYVSRYVTHSVQLDYDTVFAVDKFGNAFVCRLPESVSRAVETDPTGSALTFGKSVATGAPNKSEEAIRFHVGECLTCTAKAALVPGGSEVLLYAGALGTVGAFVPFVSCNDVDFFTLLEMHMRQEKPPLCGRDHLAYRGAYIPIRHVIDGDLCEQFTSLPPAKQREIAEELDRTPAEVLKKLEDFRATRLL